MKKINKYLKIILGIISICFAMPSIIYILKNATILNFNGNLEYHFLLTENIEMIYQAIIYTVIICVFIFCYYLIIKNSDKLFKDVKQIYKYVLAISAIFVFVVPFWSSDIFYYLGIGRLESKYKQNPYYVDMKTYVDNNNVNIESDTVMQKGYNNYWSNTTVVYGAFWTFICSVVSALSLGSVDFGLLLFKILNLIIHILNCYLIYKISRKKIFPLIYGLNPFILIEGIANVHNDLFVVFFMLLAIYEVFRKKKLTLGLLSLALATDIKYFSVLLLPFLIVYHFRDENIKTRIFKCIKFGIIFLAFAIIPYLIYIKDLSVFLGIYTQNEKLAKGLYLFVSTYFNGSGNAVEIVKTTAYFLFTALYATTCLVTIFAKKVTFYKLNRELFYYLIAFLFLLITNFQPWYFMWLVSVMMWQKSENIKLIVQMQLMTLIANIVFLVYSEKYIYGIPYFVIFVGGVLMCIIENKKDIIKRLKSKKCNKGMI